jgi:hypothetical protein
MSPHNSTVASHCSSTLNASDSVDALIDDKMDDEEDENPCLSPEWSYNSMLRSYEHGGWEAYAAWVHRCPTRQQAWRQTFGFPTPRSTLAFFVTFFKDMHLKDVDTRSSRPVHDQRPRVPYFFQMLAALWRMKVP